MKITTTAVNESRCRRVASNPRERGCMLPYFYFILGDASNAKPASFLHFRCNVVSLCITCMHPILRILADSTINISVMIISRKQWKKSLHRGWA